MPVSYKKLWKLLIDKDLKKKDLREMAKISQATMAKLAHNENVTIYTLVRICEVLECGIGDVVEIYEINKEEAMRNKKNVAKTKP